MLSTLIDVFELFRASFNVLLNPLEMVSFLDECKSLFETKCLYTILSLKKSENVTSIQIKKAYYKASLVYHPDRTKNPCPKKFQALSKAYSILSDTERRAAYDETGEVDDELLESDEQKDWYDYWRLLFKKVTVSDVENFSKQYQYSQEERDDLKKSYLNHEGKMELIMGDIMCSNYEDEPRFRAMLLEMINNNEIPKFPAFTEESVKKKEARRRRGINEAKQAKDALHELKSKEASTSDSLEQMISKRADQRAQEADTFFDHLTTKYSNNLKRPKSDSANKRKKAKH